MTSSENRNGIRILIAGGGTGGHLYPALAIAEEIRRQNPDAEFLFVGTHKKIEEKVVPSFGFKFKTIWISGFHRKVIISNLLFPLKVVVSFIQSLILILQFRPNVAVGTGGYVCGPILYTASFLRIPVLLHESNSYPGITTKLLASRATRIFLGFEAAKKYLKNNASFEVVGTPVRQNLNSASRQQALECFGLSSEKKIVLAFGGSQGAASINQAIAIGLDSGKCKDFQFIWQTGNNDYGIHKRYIRDRKSVV